MSAFGAKHMMCYIMCSVKSPLQLNGMTVWPRQHMMCYIMCCAKSPLQLNGMTVWHVKRFTAHL